jgi:hypothetical protein
MRKPGGGVPTGVAALDAALGGGLPAGRLTELVCERAGCGGQLVLARLLETTRASRRRAALIDGADAFTPDAVAEDALRHLVWVRPRQLSETLAAADVLVRDGNYAAIAIDLRDLDERLLRRVPAAHWHRLHRAAQNQPAAVLVQTSFPQVPAVPWRLSLRAPQGLEARTQPLAVRANRLTVERMRGPLAIGEELAG